MKYNSIGEQLIAKAQELDPNYKPDKFNDMSEAIDILLKNSGGGDILLNIEPYLGETITQEGYNLIEEKITSGEIIGVYIPVMSQPYILYSYLVDDDGLSGFIFDSPLVENELTRITIKKDLSFNLEQVANGSSGNSKIWFDVGSFGGTLTEEQYNTLVSYAKASMLAGIKNGGNFVPLQFINDMDSNKPTLYFEGWLLGMGIESITINGEDREVNWNTKNVLTSDNKKRINTVVSNAAVTTDDTNQRIGVDFSLAVAQDLHTFINTCINDGSMFTANFYLKTPTVNGTTLRIMTPLTLMNVHSGDDVYFSFRFYLSKNNAFDCLLGVSANNIELSFFIEDATEYTTYKSLASSLFTKQTQVKLEVIKSIE